MKKLLLLNFLFLLLNVYSYDKQITLSHDDLSSTTDYGCDGYKNFSDFKSVFDSCGTTTGTAYRLKVYVTYGATEAEDYLEYMMYVTYNGSTNKAWDRPKGLNVGHDEGNYKWGDTGIISPYYSGESPVLRVKYYYNSSNIPKTFTVRLSAVNNRPHSVNIDVQSNINKGFDATLAKNESVDLQMFSIETKETDPEEYEFILTVDGTRYKTLTVDRSSVQDGDVYTIFFTYGGADSDQPQQPLEIDGIEIYKPDQLTPDPETGEPPIQENQPPETIDTPTSQINQTQNNNETPPVYEGEHDGTSSGNEITDAINNSGYEVDISDNYEEIEFPDITDLKNTYDSFKDKMILLPQRVNNVVGTIFNLRHFPTIGKKSRFVIFGGRVVDFADQALLMALIRAFIKLMLIIWFMLEIFRAVKYLGSGGN